jgi:multiple sugar transport system ATP-binding protein
MYTHHPTKAVAMTETVRTRIALEHVSKRFPLAQKADDTAAPSVVALEDVSLTVRHGEVFALLGPSGCGKTTLLRLIAGLETPDSGRILYDQTPLADVPIRERNIGMVFQNYALIPHWQAQRSVGFFFTLRQRQPEIAPRVREIAAITGFDIDQLLPRRNDQLSGGEKQRVAIARALTRDLRVLLMDEPFANLDAARRTHARVELRRLLNQFPTTCVYVTHDQIEAVALANRIGVMHAGKLVQIGSYQQLYESPVNQFVATFIGTPTINLIDGTADSGGWRSPYLGGAAVAIRADMHGARVCLALRPEHLHLLADDAADTPHFAARITSATPYFAERYTLIEAVMQPDAIASADATHTGDAAHDHNTLRMTLPLDMRAAVPLQVGQVVRLGWALEHALYFDDLGRRVG